MKLWAQRPRLVIFIASVAIILGAIIPMQSVMAAAWDNRAFYNNSRGTGSNSYFNNARLFTLSHFYSAYDNHVIAGGIHGVTSVDGMVNFLISKNRGSAGNASEKRDVAGSAFIVHTLLGRNGDQANASGARNISDADFALLRVRLNGASINWNTTVCSGGVNTMAGWTNSNGGQADVLRDPDVMSQNQCEAGISIKNANGTEYDIFHSCANPVGDMAALADIPVIDFNLTPTISGNPKYVESGSASANIITLEPSVNNTGTTASTSAQWKVVTFNLAPSAGIPSGGQGDATPESFFGRSASSIANGSDTFEKNVNSVPVGQQTIGDLPVGTRVCYALSVQPISQSDARWNYSDPFCVTIGKAPKVQILGNDLMVGRLFAGATVAVPSSKIQTSITKKAGSSVRATAPQSVFSGLWKTGVVDDLKNPKKLEQNQPDPHWSIDRIIRPSGSTSNTCQMAVNANGVGLTSVPTTSASPRIPARTITENGARTMAGLYVASSNPDVTGVPTDGSQSQDGKSVWNLVSPNASWIGQNMYGQNYNNPNGCHDPTFNRPSATETAAQAMDDANIYVFKLEGGFTIDPSANVDLNSAKIHIKGGSDNRVKFLVNGKELSGGWQEKGWSPDSEVISGNTDNVFLNGKNSLEVLVQSTASHTGLLIDGFTIDADMIVPQANMYGSWTEYLATATGPITGIGSGSAYAGGVPTQTVCGASLLTLSNTITTDACSVGSPLGGYKTNKTIPDVASTFATNSTTPTLPSQNLTGLNGLYKASGDFAITGGDIGLGKSVIINAPNSTVTITGDIKYSTSAMTSINNIPQVIIIAKNIMINGVNENGAVKQVDAWLIASDTINTCADASTSASLTINRCKARLTVNGPVMANKLLLWRTGGSEAGAAAGDPAEVFNFRPDAYLWGISQSLKSGRLETVSERELPPRY